MIYSCLLLPMLYLKANIIPGIYYIYVQRRLFYSAVHENIGGLV